MLIMIEKGIDKLVDAVGRVLSILMLLMVLNVCFDVIMRYFFHNSSVGMQEMEWHLFSVIILFGTGVALKNESHVRVDFLYERFSARTQALINIYGTLLFLLPLALLILFGSFGFVRSAYVMQEISEDPGGLPFRWLIKAMIPLSFGFLIFAAMGYLIKNFNLYRGAKR